jgi:hypothetical protein
VVDAKGQKLTRQKGYTAISRSRTLNGVFIMNGFQAPDPPDEKDLVVPELKRMERDCVMEPRYRELRMTSGEIIKIISHNVQSINAHIRSVRNDATYTTSDVICLQETWLKDTDNYDIEGFKELSRNRLQSAAGQGTIIYGKNGRNPIDLFSTEVRVSQGHCEVTCLSLDNGLLILNVYKNPKCTRETFKEALGKYAIYLYHFNNVLVMGDFNEDVKVGSTFNNLMETDYGLKLVSPEKATTIHGTCIDGVFAKLSDYTIDCGIYNTYFSTHFPIVSKLKKK